jgi:hypothetical protein
MKTADYPGTRLRMSEGKCSLCYDAVRRKNSLAAGLRFPLLPCPAPGCGAMTRSSADDKSLAPGTRKRVNGVCFECNKKGKGNVTATKVELDGYLAGRAARLARKNRRLTAARA